jgi:large subunit ribosomal protein L30
MTDGKDIVAKKLRITQKRSTIGRVMPQKLTMRALGIRKMGQSVEHSDSPSIRGMIEKVRHLVSVEEIDGE